MAHALLETLPGPRPLTQLRQAVISMLANDQVTREGALGDLDDLREDLDLRGNEGYEEVVLTVMDQLVGFCSPVLSLTRVGSSEFDEDSDDVAYDDEVGFE